jgi:hypothetical protein
MVFLVSEAEVLCDMEGIDAFIDKYGVPGLYEAAAASDVGASAIADGLRNLAVAVPTPSEHLLNTVNGLITSAPVTTMRRSQMRSNASKEICARSRGRVRWRLGVLSLSIQAKRTQLSSAIATLEPNDQLIAKRLREVLRHQRADALTSVVADRTTSTSSLRPVTESRRSPG